VSRQHHQVAESVQFATVKMKTKTVIVGCDFGSESSKIVVLLEEPEIVRNEVGGHTTPTIISFDANNAKVRNVGATANPRAKHNTVLHLNRLLPGEKSDTDDDVLAPFYQFSCVSGENGRGCNVTNLDYNYKDGKGKNETDEYDDATSSPSKSSFSSVALLAMLFGNVQKNVESTLRRRQQSVSTTASNADTDTWTEFVYAVACPPGMAPEAQQAMLDAAYAGVGRLDDVVLVERGGAYLASYERNFPEKRNNKNTILIVDMGHAETTVMVLGTRSDETDEEDSGSLSSNSNLHLLASVRSKSLGAGNVDVRLWEHVRSTVPALHSVTKDSKAGQRLLAGTAELKNMLTHSTKASVTVEKVGGKDGDGDVKLNATRKLLNDLCQDSEGAQLTALLKAALLQAGISSGAATTDGKPNLKSECRQIDSIELVGGGCRIPFVKETIEKTVAAFAGKSINFSYSMDDSSAALGAALVADAEVVKNNALGDVCTKVYILARWSSSTTEPTEVQLALRREEHAMSALDEQMQQRAAMLNKMEECILELRSAQHQSPHGRLLPEELYAYLDEVQDWLFSEHSANASVDAIKATWVDMENRIRELSKLYQDALDGERKAKEAEMEAEARTANLEFEGPAWAEDGDHDDDDRRLSQTQRMEIVMKYSKEGGVFFGDGDYSKFD
jgi:molecular chaperone DnaK (HSP70)